ncbi:MAG: TetR/AcrR family transcriptional regulator [candidate division Zixibacteria bacterium]|nr:TetR/AcrR family transcriptional regulator [candidate division Zixibacteria bacterium]MDD5427140.1 TetR/AcrR family transcriptional regulator [candidate division Zixibacteria bacterium]
MPKIKQSPKLPPEERRQQLLKAARKLFLKKGYRMTTTEEIARTAGLTKGALYHHFKSKEDMLYELIKKLTEKMDTSIHEMIKKNMEPIEILRLMLSHHVGFEPDLMRDMIDIYAQSLRIARIKRYIGKKMSEGIRLFGENLNPRYTGDKKLLNELVVFILALHHGLSVMKMFAPSLVNEEKQIKFIETYLNLDTLAGKSKG